ncbi:hypothetical protein DR64_1620 [Paraburkholderia xenovorans LB400]|jgi:hypothetical protein|uniref:Replicase n=1 Tax=Paraburkholderia xenovorans (strain LB400) TaxID=266265 RepID=Q145D4_PARXL|nr:replication initiation protein [Paraburkholderia xenovorans]ABE29055.1 Putative replicase [Paraburkholderia xenovorans LB400]AIP31999.1 hypothetical protein DR64_1620 [Paraburkholderia xenovorans LB400]
MANQVLDTFNEHLLNKTYSTNSFEEGLKVRKKQDAISYNYVGLNKPLTKYIALDLDKGVESTYMFEKKNLPVPTLIVINRETGNCHYLYGLKKPVSFYKNSRLRPQSYLKQTTLALTHELEADIAYAHTIVKNPNSKYWKILENDVYYDLEDFEEYLDINKFDAKQSVVFDVAVGGRNVALFDNLRFWAYKEINIVDYLSYEAWLDSVSAKATQLNNYEAPLDLKEVGHTAKSVAKWVWRNQDRVKGGVNRGVMSHLGLINDGMSLEQKQSASALFTNDSRKSGTRGKITTAIIKLKCNGAKITQESISITSDVSVRTIRKYWDEFLPMINE